MDNCIVCGIEIWKATGACHFRVSLLSGEEKGIAFCEDCARQVYEKLLDHKIHRFEMRPREEILRLMNMKRGS